MIKPSTLSLNYERDFLHLHKSKQCLLIWLRARTWTLLRGWTIRSFTTLKSRLPWKEKKHWCIILWDFVRTRGYTVINIQHTVSNLPWVYELQTLRERLRKTSQARVDSDLHNCTPETRDSLWLKLHTDFHHSKNRKQSTKNLHRVQLEETERHCGEKFI